MKKIVTLSMGLLMASSMMAESLQIFKCSPDGIPGQTEPQLMGFSISADGRYVCGAIEQGAGIFAADAVTGEVKWNADGENSSELRAINNGGVAIGFIDDDGCLFSFDAGTPSLMPAPEGIRYILGEGISNDGAVKVGSFTTTSFSTEAAFSAGDDAWSRLPIPSDEELGALKQYLNGFSAAKFVSGDGSVILGHLGNMTFPIVWTRNADGEYEADFFPIRFVKAVEADRYDDSKPLYAISGMYICMSNSGRYVGAIGLIANDDNTATRIVPVFYDTQEKTLKIFSTPQDIDEVELGLYPRAVANDGTFIGCIGSPADPMGNLGCFIWKVGEEHAELYLDAFPEFNKELGESDMIGQNIPTGISADGKHILGYTYYSDDYDLTSAAPAYFVTYVISLDGSGVEQITPSSSESSAIYSIDGMRQSTLRKGLNIVRNPDGSVKKLLKQ